MNGRLMMLVAAASVAAGGASQEGGEIGRPGGAELGAWGVDLTARDESVAPGDDFNRYANGKWLDSFEIPADLSRYGSFTKLRLEAEADVRAIVEELAAAEAEQGTLEQKVGDFYRSWMDVDRLNELGAAPLKPHLDEIAAIGDREALMHAFASIHGTAPFAVGIIPDPADTTRYIAFLSQSGLGMPNRDYYLKDDERFVAYREAYLEYMSRVLTLAGIEEADAKAQAILELERKLAEVHWTPEDSRDIQKIYNPMSPEQVAELAPQFDWKLVFGQLGLGGVDTFVVAQTTAIASAGKILEETPLDLWKDYLAFHLIRGHAEYLSTGFDDAHYEFYSKTLRGTQEQRERWKRGVNQVDDSLGDAVGQIYVERHFPPEYREQMQELVGNLTAALRERLQANEWMDDETRKQALLKLSTFEPRIGYPDKWTDYASLEIRNGELLENVLSINEFLWRDQVDRLGGPVDRQRWPIPPQTVNAFYNPLMNQITFPAAILQAPFFDPRADAAVNYGAIGAGIGHEIGHGFDDQGRRFDEKGRIRDWWTETADERFSERAERLGAQYDTYSPIEGLHVKGDLTMGENIGDLGGLQMAYAAYHRYLDQCCGGEAPVLDGVTGDQRFFLSWAQVWRDLSREDALRQQLVTDPHSPPQYRVNGAVRNMDAWYDAFGVGEDAALYLAPEERVRIW
jgi:putative endopeptidase